MSDTEEKEFQDNLKEVPQKGKLEMRSSTDTRSVARQPSMDFMKPVQKRDTSQLELVIMLTKDTQTDWDWYETNAKDTSLTVKEQLTKEDIVDGQPTSPPPIVSSLDHIRTKGIQVDFLTPQTASIGIQAFQETHGIDVYVEASDDAIPEPYLELKMTKADTRIQDTPTFRKHGGATPIQEPWPPRSPLYGRPVVLPDDDDLEDEESVKQDHGDEESESLFDEIEGDEKLPQLGLPMTLQIKKDSLEPSRAKTLKELQQKISEPITRPAGEEEQDKRDATFTNLVCEFCEKTLRPFPTIEQQRTTASSELYCCDNYRKFVEFVLATDDSFEQQLKDRLYGSENNVAEAKPEKTLDSIKPKVAKPAIRKQNADDERRHKVELERHLAMLEKAKTMKETQVKDGKQQKTINFQLSKYRCYEQGMVILPPDFHLSEMEMFHHKKIQAALAAQAALQQRRQVVNIDGMTPAIEYNAATGEYLAGAPGDQNYLMSNGVPIMKKYDDKRTNFLILLADGTSTVFYPSGNVAIIVSLFNGIRTFTAFDDAPTLESRILAMFMSSGFGTVYTSDGNVRLSLTPAAGFETNPADGTKRRRWTWAEVASGNHIHAPPFQCIFYHLNSYLSVRVADYQDWTLTFFYKQYRCRFNIMAFSSFEIVDSSQFDMSDIRLVRLNKFRSQFLESRTKLRALLREINYMLGLLPNNLSKSGDFLDVTPRSSRQTARKKKDVSGGGGNKASRQSNSFLPPIVPTVGAE